MVILLPLPAYITEYRAVPFETVFIGGFGSNDVFAMTVTVSFVSVILDAAAVVVAANDAIDMALIEGVDVFGADVVDGFAFAFAMDMVLVLLWWFDWDVVVKMHGKIENADFGKPELLL